MAANEIWKMNDQMSLWMKKATERIHIPVKLNLYARVTLDARKHGTLATCEVMGLCIQKLSLGDATRECTMRVDISC